MLRVMKIETVMMIVTMVSSLTLIGENINVRMINSIEDKQFQNISKMPSVDISLSAGVRLLTRLPTTRRSTATGKI